MCFIGKREKERKKEVERKKKKINQIQLKNWQLLDRIGSYVPLYSLISYVRFYCCISKPLIFNQLQNVSALPNKNWKYQTSFMYQTSIRFIHLCLRSLTRKDIYDISAFIRWKSLLRSYFSITFSIRIKHRSFLLWKEKLYK